MSSTYVDGTTPLDAVHMNALQQKVEKDTPNGYPSLDSSGKVPLSELPPIGADLVYQGDYPAGTPYTDGEIIVYNGIAYMCVTPTSAAPAAWPGGPTPAPPSAVTAYGTTLPASPVDGQIAILVDSTTNPSYQWQFRYNASSSSTYKWEFVGGTDAYNEASLGEATTTTGVWVDLATVGPRIVVPRAGDYEAISAAEFTHTVASAFGQIGIARNAGSPVVAGRAITTPTAGYPVMQITSARLTGFAAGDDMRLRYTMTSPGSGSWNYRWIRVRPVRVS